MSYNYNGRNNPDSVKMFLNKKRREAYSKVTPEQIEAALGELYFKNTDNTILDKIVPTEEEQIAINDLKSKILSGYFYTIINPCEGVTNTRKTNLMTGHGGVIMYIDECVKLGVPASSIALAIYVQTDKDGMQCIADLSVTKIEK